MVGCALDECSERLGKSPRLIEQIGDDKTSRSGRPRSYAHGRMLQRHAASGQRERRHARRRPPIMKCRRVSVVDRPEHPCEHAERCVERDARRKEERDPAEAGEEECRQPQAGVRECAVRWQGAGERPSQEYAGGGEGPPEEKTAPGARGEGCDAEELEGPPYVPEDAHRESRPHVYCAEAGVSSR